MSNGRIAAAGPADAAGWLALRDALWPGEPEQHRAAIAAALAKPDPRRLTLLAFDGGKAIGLAEAAIRHDHVNGCDASPVLFLEGLYVAPPSRRRGVARRLVERVEAWGAAARCRELASDTDIANKQGQAMHRALGFAETERVVFFRRELGR